ncbi:MAG TPA: protein kinase [Vicinamibacterales bacterium]|nr:protein kinase [Vicinamibacterales bacterium]
MSLATGTRLGPYELQALVGSGGMGQVYRARDTRLDRTVAIKVLAGLPGNRDPSPGASSRSARLRERFDREARAVSRLNHPHICTLHDIGREGDIDFLVMEYVDGETLAAQLTRGPLPLAQAIRAAVETADALARAHAAGVVHRDLKPANIMLTKAGVKLLDFGIAKVLAADDVPQSDASTSVALTTEGTILGTIQYMAPEQLEGRTLDARTDIFAFGAVAYEMIAGRPAFDADTSAGLIAAILHSTPPSPASVQPLTPQALDRLIMTCLAKAPEDRWQSTLDLLRELRWIADRGADASSPAPAAGSAPRARRVTLFTAFLVAGALLGGGLMRWFDSPGGAPPLPIVRFPITLGSGEALETVDGHSAGPSLDLSPDGSKLVYVVERNERTQLMLRSFDRLEPVALPGTESASAPFFSPDGEWVGFIAGERLKKISTAGGAPLVLSPVPPVTRGASWAADGTIYLSPSFAESIFRIPDSGGSLTPVTSLDPGDANHLLPHVLPGGRGIIFTVWNGGSFADASLWVWSAATGTRHKLLEAATCGRYASTGHLVFARDAALLAVPFDLTTLTIRGSPVPVADGVEVSATNGTAQFALSAGGALVYAAQAAATDGADRLVWVDRNGGEQPIPDIHGDFEAARLSPDGRRVAFQSLNDLWINELGTSARRRLTFAGVNQFPVWTPDGTRIAFSHPAAGMPTPSLFWTAADGSGQPESIVTGGTVNFPSDWSPDGSVLAFSRTSGVVGNWDILTWARQDGQTSIVENSAFNELQPAFSPDGKWLAYVSDSSGRREVYVRPYPSPGARIPVSSDGGEEPRWGPDSKELFYVQGRSLMRVTIKTTPALGASKAETLFERRYRRLTGSPGFTSYSVAAASGS